MDAGIAATINDRTARAIANHLDLLDWFCGIVGDETTEAGTPWQRTKMADRFMDEKAVSNGERAWLLGALAVKTPGVDFDGIPADCDWEGIFATFRAEIAARRGPKTPHGQSGCAPLAGVV